MITLNEIAEIAEITKCSALKMAESSGWESRKACINKRLVNTYNITREELKAIIAKKSERKEKMRLAALRKSGMAGDEKSADQLSTEPQLRTVDQIKQVLNVKRHRATAIIKRARWEPRKILKYGRWTLHYLVSDKQIAEATTDYFSTATIFEKPKSSSGRLPFDEAWVKEWGEAPTLTILKKLDELSWPWGAHPAKSIIKPRELFA